MNRVIILSCLRAAVVRASDLPHLRATFYGARLRVDALGRIEQDFERVSTLRDGYHDTGAAPGAICACSCVCLRV